MSATWNHPETYLAGKLARTGVSTFSFWLAKRPLVVKELKLKAETKLLRHTKLKMSFGSFCQLPIFTAATN